METQEREYVVDNLVASETRLMELTKGLKAEQWDYQESAERWSIAENIEHCILVEKAILGGIKQALTGAKETEKRASVVGKEAHVKGVGNPTGRKLEAQEAFQPTGRWPEPLTMLMELQRVRAGSKEFARTTDADLRDHFFPHQALGDLDCYQWMVVMAQHGERHAKQIEQVMVSAGFPG